jgi:hypothetical protein
MKKPLLTRLRELPEERRKMVAASVAGAVTMVIFLVWAVSFSVDTSSEGGQKTGLFAAIASIVAPFKNIAAQAVGALEQTNEIERALTAPDAASTSPQQ